MFVFKGPYKLSEQEKRSYGALFNHSCYGAFRHAPQEHVKSLGTREKQAWEGLGNITKVESMRRFVEKVKKLKIDYDLAVKNAELNK